MTTRFVLYALPHVRQKTAERLAELHEAIDELSEIDLGHVRRILNQTGDGDKFDLFEIPLKLREAVDKYWGLGSHGPEHDRIQMYEWLMPYCITGGPSQGDPPTQLCDTFLLIRACAELYQLLAFWAQLDDAEAEQDLDQQFAGG